MQNAVKHSPSNKSVDVMISFEPLLDENSNLMGFIKTAIRDKGDGFDVGNMKIQRFKTF